MEGFDEFWKAYPRRVAKLAAQRSYKRALTMTTSERIIDAAKRYAADRAGKDHQYTAHPASWLNAGRWDDYETPPDDPSGIPIRPGSPQWRAWRDWYVKNNRSVAFMDAQAIKGGSWTVPSEYPQEDAA